MLLPLLLFALVQTPPGKALVASVLSKALSRSEHLDVRIGRIQGWIPGKVQVDEVRVGDAEGLWLEARGVHGRWMIRELLHHRVRLRSLGAADIKMHRLPKALKNNHGAKSEFKPMEIHLDGLRIDRLALGRGVLGIPLEYSVHSGGIQWLASGELSGELVVGGDAEGRIGLTGRNGCLALKMELERMLKPAFGLDHLSGKGEVSFSRGKVEGGISARLEEAGWAGHIDTGLHYADHGFKLQKFQFSDSNYSAQGDLSLSFSNGYIGVVLDSSFVTASSDQFGVHGIAGVATGNKGWAVDVQSLDIRGWETVLLTLSGKVDPAKVELVGQLAEFDVGQLPMGGISNFSGTVNGRISVTGPLEDPQVSAELKVADLASVLDELPPLDFRITGGVAHGELFGAAVLSDSASGRFDGTLSMPCVFSVLPFDFSPEPKKTDGQLDAHLDLSVFNRLAFFGNQHVAGLLVAKLGYEDRVPSGFLRLERGRYEHFDWGIVSRDLELKLAAVPGGFRVEHGAATDGQGGTVALSGTLDAAGPDLEVSFASAKVLRREEVEARISGRLAVSGRYARPQVEGRLVVDRADILPDNIAPPAPLLLVDYDAHAATHAAVAEVRRPLPFSLDMQVDMPDQVFVNASLIDSVWGGGVRLTDTPAGISVKGRIEPKRGHVSFIGKKFRFTEGEVLFDGAIPAVGVMNNLTAEYARSDVTARLVLGGRANDPQFRLESTPAMPQDEVLSHVLFNRNTSTISPYQAFQIASAARQLSGGMNGPGFMYQVRQAVGVDTLEWREADAGGSGSVAAGKYITPSLYVEIDQPFDSTGEAGMLAEYELTRHFSVETSTGPELRPGIGVNWKIDY